MSTGKETEQQTPYQRGHLYGSWAVAHFRVCGWPEIGTLS